MSFKDMMADDLQNTILNTSEFAEPITYITKAGVESSMDAIVDRDLLGPAGAGGADTLSKYIDVQIANDSSAGVTSVDLNGDYVMVPEYVGSAPARYRIIEILEVNEASWTLRCVK